MNDEVVVPELEASVNVEEFKDEELLQQEAEQKALEQQLKNEIEHPNFPLIRQHIEGLIEQYGDVRSLAENDSEPVEFKVQTQVKALFVKEMRDLINAINQLTEVDTDNGSSQ